MFSVLMPIQEDQICVCKALLSAKQRVDSHMISACHAQLPVPFHPQLVKHAAIYDRMWGLEARIMDCLPQDDEILECKFQWDSVVQKD